MIIRATGCCIFLFSLSLYAESVSITAEIPAGFHILTEAPIEVKTTFSKQFEVISQSRENNRWTFLLKTHQGGRHSLSGTLEFFICDNKLPCKKIKHSFSKDFNAK